MTRLLTSAAIAALLVASPAAQADDYSGNAAVHDVIVTSPVPHLSVTVRNMAQSTNPADRDLRVVSAPQSFDITGQVWCANALGTPAYAAKAQTVFSHVIVHAWEAMWFSTAGASPVRTFDGAAALENFSLPITYAPPTSWEDNAITLDLNPVKIVEDRLAQFVEHGAGTEADFLRVTDVFEATQSLGVVGWCRWDEFVVGREYAGVRSFDVPLRIFYQGDPDIRDTITTVGQPGTMQARQPSRARAVAAARGAGSRPPARAAEPARAPRRAPQN